MLNGSAQKILRDVETQKFHCDCGYSAKLTRQIKNHCKNMHGVKESAEKQDSSDTDTDSNYNMRSSQRSKKKEKKYLRFLSSIGFRLNMDHKILICVDCEHACIPSHIPGHVKLHKIPKGNIESTIAEIVEYFQVNKTNDVPKPHNIVDAIEGLKVHPGLKCGTCNYVCCQSETFRKHAAMHARRPTVSECHVQTFFNPLPIRYFQVNVSKIDDAEENPFEQFLQDIASSMPKFDLGDLTTTRDLPLLLKKTHWDLYLDEWLKDPVKRKEIKSLATNATKKEPWSINILRSVKDYLRNTREEAINVEWVALRNMMKGDS